MINATQTVSDINATIRQLLARDAALQDVWVTGEVSNMTRAASGHWYFTLKDAKSQLRCVMFRSSVQRQIIEPREGDAINVHGRIGVYEARGEYQLYADTVQAAGAGDLYQQFEMLKQQLAAEGLFEQQRPLPTFPRKIGVVTSPDAAAFRDVQNVLKRRYPLAEIILSPTLVQGADAPPQIVAAIERINRYTDADVLLICRGGGSIEDLWGFNDERVARAAAASRIPTVSGVGHETDFTIVDFVVDQRAPTPSAAAEIATPNAADLLADLRQLDAQFEAWMQQQLRTRREALQHTRRSLHYQSPQNTIQNHRQRVDEMTQRMANDVQRRMQLWRERLHNRRDALEAANPDAILARGYAIITQDDQIISQTDAVATGDTVKIRLQDGELHARIEDEDDRHNQRTLF